MYSRLGFLFFNKVVSSLLSLVWSVNSLLSKMTPYKQDLKKKAIGFYIEVFGENGELLDVCCENAVDGDEAAHLVAVRYNTPCIVYAYKTLSDKYNNRWCACCVTGSLTG